jgi:hypothetical protein
MTPLQPALLRTIRAVLGGDGSHVLNFHLNLAKAEQCERLSGRPEWRWNFWAGGVEERDLWGEYMTSTDWAPWHIIPADSRRFARATAASVIVSRVKSPAVGSSGRGHRHYFTHCQHSAHVRHNLTSLNTPLYCQ